MHLFTEPTVVIPATIRKRTAMAIDTLGILAPHSFLTGPASRHESQRPLLILRELPVMRVSAIEAVAVAAEVMTVAKLSLFEAHGEVTVDRRDGFVDALVG